MSDQPLQRLKTLPALSEAGPCSVPYIQPKDSGGRQSFPRADCTHSCQMPDGFCACQCYWLYAPSVLFLKRAWVACVLTFPHREIEKNKRVTEARLFSTTRKYSLANDTKGLFSTRGGVLGLHPVPGFRCPCLHRVRTSTWDLHVYLFPAYLCSGCNSQI